ncbi:hypothetical protein PV326_006927 [Microctonus aethiopoides]|nr:hypothetical protein PV326_006927 [Microctonus aethiopoides]
MSFRKQHGSKVNVDYKARLEHKLYLARENPEPTFDICDCALKNVPSGIYSLCKVFRKKELRMSKNKLSSLLGGGRLCDLSLLTVLDLSYNEFTNLPGDISSLTSLEELYLQYNSLKKLPSEITQLSKLFILNLSNNKLKYLPDTMGNLQNLNELNISNNDAIEKLPKSLGQAQNLVDINLNGLNITYPPKSIIECGVSAIIKYLAREYGVDYKEQDNIVNNHMTGELKSVERRRLMDLRSTDENVQAVLSQLEKSKARGERRQNALLEVEKNIREQQEFEMELQSIHQGQKKKLLEDLALQQSRLESKIERVQYEREINRSRLITLIFEAEKEADSVIEEFLRSSEAERQAQAELLDREKKEQFKLLSQSHLDQSAYRTKETLLAMEELLKEELLAEKKIEEYTKFRECTAQSLLSLELRSNDHLASVVEDQKRDREDLIDRLRKDVVLQKAALAALLERSDARSWSIVQQVNLVQSQLVALTNIELERKKLEINQQINDIAEKRVILSGILVGLLNQQQKRREQLLDTINQIEQRRQKDTTRRDSLFWLIQYQSLMDARPQGLLEGLDSMLVRHVAIAGALHCLPFLASLPTLLPNVDNDQLDAIGIHNENDQRAIIMAVENYLAEKKIYSENSSRLPSAPMDNCENSSRMASAPFADPCTSSENIHETSRDISRIDTTECVICLDSQCEVIYLPCGHFCCCASCSNMVTSECPLCRGSIQRKIQVHKP